MSMENLGPYSNFHELNQDWFLNEFNKLIEQWKAMQKNFDNLNDAFNDLKNYIQDYFKNLDVQEEIDNKLNQMASDGTLSDIIKPLIMSTLPPLVVDNVSDMKDITRTYILKSNSHIYQYIGSAWSDTGIVYGGTIGNMLESAGFLPINSDFDDITSNTIYCLYEQSTANYVNYPFSEINSDGFIITSEDINRGFKMQYVVLNNGISSCRIYSHIKNIWENWYECSNFIGKLPNNTDLNNVSNNTLYYVGAQINSNYGNYPSFFNNTVNGLLETYGYGNTITQIMRMTDGTSAIRLCSSGAWREWKVFSNYYKTLPNNTDLNNVSNNTMYYIGAQINSNYGNYPSFFNTTVNGLLETYGDGNTITQIMRMTDGTSAIRLYSSGTWRDWETQSFIYGENLEPFNSYNGYYSNFGTFKETFFNTINSVIFSTGDKHYFNKMSEYVNNTYYTLIDDDISTENYVDLYYRTCIENSVIGNYAVITEHLSETMTPKLKQYEQEGFTMLYHCHSQIKDYNNTTRNQNVLTNFVNGLREFNEAGFINCGAWVIPFGNSNKSIVELAYMYGFDGAFLTGNSIPAFSQRSPYSIPRISVGPSTKGGKYKSLDELKQIIDMYDGRNTWFVFTTHANSWDDDGIAKKLFSDLISYIKSKNWNNVNASEGFMLFKNYLNGIF